MYEKEYKNPRECGWRFTGSVVEYLHFDREVVAAPSLRSVAKLTAKGEFLFFVVQFSPNKRYSLVHNVSPRHLQLFRAAIERFKFFCTHAKLQTFVSLAWPFNWTAFCRQHFITPFCHGLIVHYAVVKVNHKFHDLRKIFFLSLCLPIASDLSRKIT